MRYKAILFDNDDTLMDFQKGNRNAINHLMDELGYFDPNRYDQYENINLECWAALEKGEMNQGQLRYERFIRFFDRYHLSGNALHAADRFVELLGGQSILLPHVQQVVKIISQYIPVIIVTNGITAVQKNRIARSPLNALVSDVIISDEVGTSKPNPDIFILALRRINVDACEALMIGDSVNSDIRGANNAGIDACWFNPSVMSLPEGIHAEYTITDIRECVDIALQA